MQWPNNKKHGRALKDTQGGDLRSDSLATQDSYFLYLCFRHNRPVVQRTEQENGEGGGVAGAICDTAEKWKAGDGQQEMNAQER